MNETTSLDYQFFPTPKALAVRMWKKFKSREVTRCLEPSCGNADLLLACMEHEGRGAERLIDYSAREFSNVVDVCEIDVTKHARLREMGFKLVGFDFLEMTNGAAYSHIILNPPFAQGVQHALHAWDILWDGEIVALLNAESLRNPFSAERQQLAGLIAAYGEVDFITDAFMTSETARKTEVECALRSPPMNLILLIDCSVICLMMRCLGSR
jgi:hypothetical protein